MEGLRRRQEPRVTAAPTGARRKKLAKLAEKRGSHYAKHAARYRSLQQQSRIESDEKGHIGKTETRGLSERVQKQKRHTITRHTTISNSSKTKGKKRQVERVRRKGCKHRLNSR